MFNFKGKPMQETSTQTAGEVTTAANRIATGVSNAHEALSALEDKVQPIAGDSADSSQVAPNPTTTKMGQVLHTAADDLEQLIYRISSLASRIEL